MEIEQVEQPVEANEFPFTNYTDEDFMGMWDSQGYVFPANSTVPMLGMIPSASPLEIQSIRKKFANDLGIQEFYKSKEFKKADVTIEEAQAGKVPALANEKDFTPYVQRCLEPLPKAKAVIKEVPRKEVPIVKDAKGKPGSRVLEEGESLIQGQDVIT